MKTKYLFLPLLLVSSLCFADPSHKGYDPKFNRSMNPKITIPEANEQNCADLQLFDSLFYKIMNEAGSARNTNEQLNKLQAYEEKCQAMRKAKRLEELKAANKQREAANSNTQSQKDSLRERSMERSRR